MLILVEFPDAACTLVDLFGMVGIVAQEDQFVGLDLKVKASINTSIGLNAVFQFFSRTTVELCHGHGGYRVLDVDRNGLSELDILDAFDGGDEIEGDLTVSDMDVLSVEIAFIEAVVIAAYSLLQMFLHLQVAVDYECTAWLNQFTVVAETFQIGLLGAIDVEVIRISRSDDSHPGTEPVEGTVKLISLDDDVVGIREDIVCAVVLGDAPQEGIAVEMALVHDVGAHGGSSCLAVRTSHTESFVGLCQYAKHLGSLHNLKTVLSEEDQFLMISGYGRCVNDKACLLLFAGKGYTFHVFLVVDHHSFLLKLMGEVGRCLVVACHDETLFQEIAGDGAHANAAGSYEIYCFNIFKIHNF